MTALDHRFKCKRCGLFKGTLNTCVDEQGIHHSQYNHEFVELTEGPTSEICDPKHDKEFLPPPGTLPPGVDSITFAKETAEADEILCDWCGEPLKLTPETSWTRVHMMKGDMNVRMVLRGCHGCVDFSVPRHFFKKLYSQ